MKALITIIVVLVITVAAGTVWMNREINKRVKMNQPDCAELTWMRSNPPERCR